MTARVPLPPHLASRSFTVASALDGGVGAGRLRAPDLARPFSGVRAPAGTLDSVLELCRAYLPLLSEARFFSHATAALLWECPLPEGIESRLLHVASSGRGPRGHGVVGHQVFDARTRIILRHGMPAVDPATLFCQLAVILALDDLVAVGDHLILDPAVLDPRDIRPYLSMRTLRERVESFSGRGARAAASAILLIRQGAESRPETLLRLLLQRADLPEPEVNPELWNAHGRWLGRADLVYPAWRVIVEYDGDQHRTDTHQYEKDIARIEGLIEAGWAVIRVRARGLFATPDETVARVVLALRNAGWSPS